jgi:hypothetical protein
MSGATWIRTLLGGSSGAADLLLLAHGQLVTLRSGDAGQELMATHLGTYACSEDAATCLAESVNCLKDQRGGRWDIFIGADLAPCMVLERDNDVALANAQWVELATVALMPVRADERDFVLRLSGTASDRRRIACFVPSVLLAELRSPAIQRVADIRRCEPLAALAAAIGPSVAAANSDVPSWLWLRLGGIDQAVLVAPDGQTEQISRLLTDRCQVGRRLGSDEEGPVPPHYTLDLDAMMLISGGGAARNDSRAVEAIS